MISFLDFFLSTLSSCNLYSCSLSSCNLSSSTFFSKYPLFLLLFHHVFFLLVISLLVITLFAISLLVFFIFVISPLAIQILASSTLHWRQTYYHIFYHTSICTVPYFFNLISFKIAPLRKHINGLGENRIPRQL